MRKYFVIGLYLIIIGGLLLGGGLVMGAEKTVLWDHGFKISRQIDKTETVPKFNKIKVDDDAHSVNIETGDSYKVHVVGDLLRSSEFYVSDGTLHITSNKSGKYSDIVSGYKNPSITITVPASVTLKELNLNMNQLGMDVNGAKIDNLVIANGSNGSLNFIESQIKNAKNIELDSSYLEFQQTDIENFELNESNNSNLEFIESNIKNSKFKARNMDLSISKGILDNLTVESRNGSTRISQSTLQGKNLFKMRSGSFSANGTNVDGLDLSTANGNISYYGNAQGKSYQHDIDSENLLKVQTTNGSIHVGGNE
ncbi:hypothetical protein FD03_GL000052 [Companilactobacillus nodensis DSM 19682 = JCM 14932 = NBRC 107160]|uniref:DUF4097 domain-containing protein n=1 Tax=Companilactobacillus nodensis DSM 19682 = JCM 14932 = NBRC 107160 TaxID=1423775 RepID=A0A0R1K9X9_9LACO|nr:DUF4097 family beta strand repeat-containing protein [Companilactobacillus nodensis]KRK80171.1 hypothetical protein FD03_GL000052 [Companilactobacillus nodensis DSM 19682 = JCM 14932 = NBRC 107160]